MKLIIEVEKDYYEMLKYNVEHGQDYKPFEIIANGMPYEERPKGEWIDLDTDESWYRFKCSNCLTLFPRGLFMKGYPYCPRCGTYMRGEKE